jgi:regulatory protein
MAAVLAAKLRVGQRLSPEQIESLRQSDRLEKGKKSAIRFIAYRPRSIAEVRRNLSGKGYEDSEVAEIIERLKETGLVDDEEFARYWVEQRETFRPRGRFALSFELRQKGLDRELIETVLSDVDEMTGARRAITRQVERWSKLPFAEYRTKLGRFLQRRGYGHEIINQIVDETWRTVSSYDREDRDATF